jgi:hypothetical protein
MVVETRKKRRPQLTFDDCRFSLALHQALSRAGLSDYRAARLTAAMLGDRQICHADLGHGFVRIGTILDVSERGRSDRIVRRSREQLHRVLADPCGESFNWLVDSIVGVRGAAAALLDRDVFRFVLHLDNLVALGWGPTLRHALGRLATSNPVAPSYFEADGRAACVVLPALNIYGFRRFINRTIVFSDGDDGDEKSIRNIEEKSQLR